MISAFAWTLRSVHGDFRTLGACRRYDRKGSKSSPAQERCLHRGVAVPVNPGGRDNRGRLPQRLDDFFCRFVRSRGRLSHIAALEGIPPSRSRREPAPDLIGGGSPAGRSPAPSASSGTSPARYPRKGGKKKAPLKIQ